MIDRLEMAERHGRTLARLAELALSMAEDLHADAAQADDGSKRAEAAGAFHKIARTVRQTVALEARLARDVTQAQQEARNEAERTHKAKVYRRRAQVAAVLEREIWNEYEADDAQEQLEVLDDLLNELVLADDFLDVEIEAHIEGLRRSLGLPSGAGPGDPGRAGLPFEPVFDSSD